MIEVALFVAVVVALAAFVRAQDAAVDATRLRRRVDDLEDRLRRLGSEPGAPPTAANGPDAMSVGPETEPIAQPRSAPPQPAPDESKQPVTPASEPPLSIPSHTPTAPTPASFPPGPAAPSESSVPPRPLAPLPASLREPPPALRRDPAAHVWDDDEPLPVVGRSRATQAAPPLAAWGPASGVEAEDESPAGDPAGFEARFGSTWLLRIGLVLLAIAAALFSLVLTPRLGPAGKTALGYGFAALLFSAGLLSRRLQAFAQPVMAGALSIGFFVSYAAGFIEPMRCMPVAASVASMGGFAGAILVFSDRWRSEFTAGLALFLGHVAAFVAARNLETGGAASLVAVVILSLSAVVMLLRRTWLVLSLFAVVAAYLSHLLWTSLADEGVSPRAALAINVAFLSSYYFIFAASDLIWWRLHRSPASPAAPPGEAASLRASPALGAALGPLNLVLYTAVVSWMYLRTGVELERIHYFYFALAAVQGLLAVGHRTEGNPDTAFYPASATVLLTLGFFSAFETLALNLVLAAEAMVLLVVAHQTRLRMFHLLSQAALLANFVHYWIVAPDMDPTRGQFIGGMLTSGVYFVKSALEEIWYGPGTTFAWREQRPKNLLLRELADAFRDAYRLMTPFLAHLHAAAGALILTDQCGRFLVPFDAGLVLAIGSVAFAAFGAWRRSVPLLIAATVAYLGVVRVADLWNDAALAFYSKEVVGSGGRALLAALGALASAVGFAILAAGTPARRFSFSLYPWPAVILAAVLIAFLRTPLGLPEGYVVFGLRFAGSILGLVAIDRFSASWRSRPEAGPSLRPAFTVLEILPGLILAFHFAELMDWRFESRPIHWVLLSGWASLLPLLAIVRRTAGIYACGVTLMLLLTFGLADSPHARENLLARITASTATFLPLLAAGWAQDFTLGRAAAHLTAPRLLSARLLIAIPYAAGMIVLAWLLEARIGTPWLHASIGVAALALLLATVPPLLSVGPAVARASLVLACLAFFVRYLGGDEPGAAFLCATGALVLAAILMERAGKYFGTPAALPTPDQAAVRLGIEWALLLSATLVALTGAYASSIIGAQWSTAAWTIYAALIMALGFAWRSAPYRRTALGVLAVCLARVFLVDIRDLERIYQAVALLVLGLSLVAIAWLYSRFGRQLRRWL